MLKLNCRSLIAGLLTVLGLVGAGTAHAEDIDIFSANNVTTDLPNVILVLDNSSNWSSANTSSCTYVDIPNAADDVGTKFFIGRCALYNAIHALPTGTGGSALFNVALMMKSDSPNSVKGYYPRKAFIPLTSSNKDVLKTMIKGLKRSEGANNALLALSLYEAYLYYKGTTPYMGDKADKKDVNAFQSGLYKSPSIASCGRNFIILIANGSPEPSENNDSESLLKTAGGNINQIVYPTAYISSNDQKLVVDEMARFLVGQDVSNKEDIQNITTFTISVTGAASDKTYPNYFNAVAKAGGGDGFTASTADQLTKAVGDIFNQIQAVNSVFASASLPASVSARGSYLNQVYMGVFRPDGNAQPRWRGNLKQYKFNYDPATDSLALFDKAGNSAISAVTGFISPSAVSFWTESETSPFWVNELLGTPATASDSPDGEVVEKGGAAQRIRTTFKISQATRNVYTCVGCSTTVTNLTDTVQSFATATTSITANMLRPLNSSGVVDSTVTVSADERDSLINWVRGTDNFVGDEKGPGGTVTIRPSVHGDVLHSRPLALNYGSAGVMVFYGTNDGALRAINGNQAGTNAGNELWSFIPEENFRKFKRLRDNTPEIKLSTTPATATTALPRDYLVDGPISAYQKFSSSTTVETAYLYFGMRRGGRVLYSLDVTTPSAPKFRWKKNNSDLTWSGGSLGQTWSEPKVASVKVAGVNTPVLIMGGGYDAAAEDSATPDTTTMGNAVLVLDASTGALLKAFPTTRSVPADVTLVDTDKDGLVDRVYAIDIGGDVYRIDLGTAANSAVTNWGSYKLASLGGGGTRKFFFAPDVVTRPTFTAILVGSGDREKPLNTTVAGTDRFFTVFDALTTRGTPATTPTEILPTNLGLVGSDQSMTVGCYIPMAASEKIVNQPLTVEDATYFGTNAPKPADANMCSSNLGRSKVYSAPAFCKAAASEELNGGGLPPSPVTGIVNVSYTLPDGTTATKDIKYVIGAPNPKKSSIEVKKVTSASSASTSRRRLYWFMEGAR